MRLHHYDYWGHCPHLLGAWPFGVWNDRHAPSIRLDSAAKAPGTKPPGALPSRPILMSVKTIETP
jgi:hypothetical protein